MIELFNDGLRGGISTRGSTTRELWYSLGQAHDFELKPNTTPKAFYFNVFTSHFTQLALIAFWSSAHIFHIAWQGQFSRWIASPQTIRPIAHTVRDPQLGEAAVSSTLSIVSTSGLYQWYATTGITSEAQCFRAAAFLLACGTLGLVAGAFHGRSLKVSAFSWDSLLTHHASGLLGVGSLAWAGHIIHVALPVSRHQFPVRTAPALFNQLCHPLSLAPIFRFEWFAYAANPDGANHIFGQEDAGVGTAILTFLGGRQPVSGNLWLSDIAHHHLAIGIIFVIGGNIVGQWQQAWTNSLHFQLALSLAFLGTASSLTAQHMDALPPYVYLASDFLAQAALYTHHQYIAGFFMCGAFAHGAIYLVRDDQWIGSKNATGRLVTWLVNTRQWTISHLSAISLFLGFHTLGLYVHNDVMQALATPEKQIGIAPVFAQWVQAAHGHHLGFAITSGDVLVHHGIALGLHVTTLILLKAALNSRSSKLFPDKVAFGYGFACDGPGRGGT